MILGRCPPWRLFRLVPMLPQEGSVRLLAQIYLRGDIVLVIARIVLVRWS